MSGAGSKMSDAGQASAPFTEADHRETPMPYGEGGVPFYIAVAWAIFIVTYIVFMAIVALPDLRAWMAG
jgi:hypothetical protein